MPLRSRWIAVPAAVTAASAFYLWYAWGSSGISGLFVLLFVVVGLVGPVFAAASLGASAPTSPELASPPIAIPGLTTPPFPSPHSTTPPSRNNLLALLGIPAAAGLLFGWFGGDLSYTLVLVFMVMTVLSACAFLATAAHRSGLPGSGGFESAARSYWSLVLVGGVFCCVSLPAACASQAYSVERAKAWVEAAAAEVRAVERSTGRIPADLAEILPRVGPAPRGCRPSDGVYRPFPETGNFRFVILDSEGLIDDSWWIYDGRTGEWSFVPG